MTLHEKILQLRIREKLTQEQFAERLEISHQSVQKWESGENCPDLKNLVRLSRQFGVSLDYLLTDSDAREIEELQKSHSIQPNYAGIEGWESYAKGLETDLRQSLEEGKDLKDYADLFHDVAKMPEGTYKTKMADILFDLSCNAPQREDFPYYEPSDYAAIAAARAPLAESKRSRPGKAALREKLAGAWYGRICGCLLGKPIEGIRTDELHPLLKESGNFPMHRYILSTDITRERAEKCSFVLEGKCYPDTITCAPSDDDTNYTVLYQSIIEKYGRGFKPADVAEAWLASQPKYAYCTAERVAFCNFVKGFCPPDSALYKNPYREWIGAQIRADYFGYINPGDPAAAAEMAWRDASISHTKNGIYGEMFVAAMLAWAAVSDDTEEIIRQGLAQIPESSRLYEAITRLLEKYHAGMGGDELLADIHSRWNEHDATDWCHTISNAEIVAACLLCGGNDYGKSICMAVQTGFDTDCNGATVGSIMGMKNGIRSIGSEWTAPVRKTLATCIFGKESIQLEELVENTLKHMA